MVYHTLAGTPFVPFGGWILITAVLGGATAFLTAYFYVDNKINGNGEPIKNLSLQWLKKLLQSDDKFKNLLTLILAPIIGILLIDSAITQSLGALVTNSDGRKYESIIIIPDKNHSTFGSLHCREGYTPFSPQLLNMSVIKELCIDPDTYDSLKSPGVLHVSGKESALGRTISDYKISVEHYDIETIQEIYPALQKEWMSWKGQERRK